VADRKDIDFSYTLTDRVIRLALGELADFSAAKYDGDVSLTLEQAQRRKHEYVAEQIGLAPGHRVIDLGCGWGPLLNFFRSRGATGLGVTLSSAQVESCQHHGLDVRLHDARTVTRDTFGSFDSAVSVGAFEHFASREDYDAGRHDDVYRNFFANVASVLPDRGRLYLQTMVFGRNMIPIEQVDRHAPRESDAWYLAMMQAAFPGSFLPFGSEHVERCADPHFRLVSKVSGRVDYIQTIHEWDKLTEAWNPRMALLKLRLIPKWLTSPEFRFAFTRGASSNLVCFERELMDHFRFVFEKI
jgi:cyclopropane-fatty-acyl-phospholipid synthase